MSYVTNVYAQTSRQRWTPAFAGAESGFAGVTERLCLGHFVIPSPEGIHLSAANVCGGSVNFALRC
jgi:hypothetical protein